MSSKVGRGRMGGGTASARRLERMRGRASSLPADMDDFA